VSRRSLWGNTDQNLNNWRSQLSRRRLAAQFIVTGVSDAAEVATSLLATAKKDAHRSGRIARFARRQR
jgi:hypothetical protein